MSDEALQDRDAEDWLAAEMALGLLDGDALAVAARRMREDRAFSAAVARWQMRFSGLDDGFEPVTPPAALRRAISDRLFGPTPSLAARLWNSVPLWRGLAALGVAAAVVLSLDGTPPPTPLDATQVELITALFAPGGDVAFITRYDAERAVLRVTRLAGEAGPGQDLQLWFAPTPEGTPVSMGVVPAEQTYEIDLSPEIAGQMSTQAHFGISLEQEGGSPTGRPTQVLVVADVLAI